MMSLFPDFYNTTNLQQIAINVFYGWGYNFFKTENQLRADSALIRDKTADLIGEIRAAMTRAEIDFRQRMLPEPTRDGINYTPAALTACRQVESLIREIGNISSIIRAAPVPETDRMRQRFRREADLLHKLVEADQLTVGKATLLNQLFKDQRPLTGEWLVEHRVELETVFRDFEVVLQNRKALLNL